MALIKCEDCGREISDKVKACPHCGCPLEEHEEIKVTHVLDKSKKISKKMIAMIMGILLIVIIGGFTYYSIAIKPANTYEEAMILLEKGKYDDAKKLLDSIQKYQDVEEISEQMKYESMAYECISDLKKYLKNPDSFQPYEITFYNISEAEDVDLSKISASKPVCVMHYGAQNGFGGNTTGYVLFIYSDEDKKYSTLGSCDSLDVDEIDDDDEMDLLVCQMINLYKDYGEETGGVDIARVKTVLKNDAYSTIKIIE